MCESEIHLHAYQEHDRNVHLAKDVTSIRALEMNARTFTHEVFANKPFFVNGEKNVRSGFDWLRLPLSHFRVRCFGALQAHVLYDALEHSLSLVRDG